MRKKKGSTNQRNNGNNNHSQESKGEEKGQQGMWSGIEKATFCTIVTSCWMKNNNGFKIVDKEQCELHTEREKSEKQRQDE